MVIKVIVKDESNLHYFYERLFFRFYDKMPNENDLRKQGLVVAHSWRVQPPFGRKLRPWQFEAAGHMGSSVKR